MSEGREEPRFASWCLVELMGHRKLAGYVTDDMLAGVKILRIDEPDLGPDRPGRSVFFNTTAIYALRPATEELVMAMAPNWVTPEITEWSLPSSFRQAVRAALASVASPQPDAAEAEHCDCEGCIECDDQEQGADVE